MATIREELAAMNVKLDQLMELKTDIKTIQAICPAHGQRLAHLEERCDAQDKITVELRKDVDTIYNRLWAAIISLLLLMLSAGVGMIVKANEYISSLSSIAKKS